MADEYIKIKQVTDDCFMVEWQFASGYQATQRCESEIEARVFARGVESGISSVRSALTVPTFGGRIESYKPGQTGGEITYAVNTNGNIRVFVDGVRTGMIMPREGGYAYQPKMSNAWGPTFATIDEVKKSLETD